MKFSTVLALGVAAFLIAAPAASSAQAAPMAEWTQFRSSAKQKEERELRRRHEKAKKLVKRQHRKVKAYLKRQHKAQPYR